MRDSYDVGPGSGGGSELTYEGISIGVHNNYCLLGSIIWYSNNVHYSYMMNNCKDCFGCAELNGKQYCILNKQYTKEEYENLLPKVIQHMMDVPFEDKKGKIYRFGEYFPPEISPYAYNETVAQDYFPLKKETAEEKGYLWREYESGIYTTDINGSDLPDTILEADNSILEKTIACEITGRPYRITEQEFSFYKRMNLPLPSVHPDERHNARLRIRNPMKLHKRMCFFGDKEVDTTFPPVSEGGPEKVVCTEHYNKEVY